MGRAVVSTTMRSLAATALLLVTTACASGTATFASRFIREGTPTVDIGGPKVPSIDGAFTSVRSNMAGQAATRPLHSAGSLGAGTLESSSQTLSLALAALALAPTAEHYLNVAHAYASEGVRDKAFDYLNEGLKVDRHDAALHDAVARAWRDWGFLDRALSAANRATYYAPASAEVHNTLGTVLWALGQHDGALQAWEQATVLDPGAWYAWHNLCEAALAAARTNDAANFCGRANARRRSAKAASP